MSIRRIIDIIREKNTTWRDRMSGSLAALLAFALMLAVFLGGMAWRGEFDDPPTRGDGPDYDAIAYGLVNSHGFAYYRPAEYRATYEAANEDGAYDYLLVRDEGPNTTAYRPPALPFLLAATYEMFGRQWAPIRVLNAIGVAVAMLIYASILWSQIGAIPAAGFLFVVLVIDARWRALPAGVLTESLAVLVLAVMFWLLVKAASGEFKHRFMWPVLVGVMAGVGVLLRSALVCWLPGWVLLAWAIAWRVERRRFLGQVAVAGTVAAVSLLVLLPWMIRNIVVLETAEMPLGTQGYIGLAPGFTDEAIEHGGMFYRLPPEYYPPELRGEWTLEKEKGQSLYSRDQIKAWIWENPEKLLPLTWTKIVTGWWPYSITQGVLYLFALPGILFAVGRPIRLVAIAIMLFYTLQIAMTFAWTVRYLVPFIGVLILCSVAFVWRLFELISTKKPKHA